MPLNSNSELPSGSQLLDQYWKTSEEAEDSMEGRQFIQDIEGLHSKEDSRCELKRPF